MLVIIWIEGFPQGRGLLFLLGVQRRRERGGGGHWRVCLLPGCLLFLGAEVQVGAQAQGLQAAIVLQALSPPRYSRNPLGRASFLLSLDTLWQSASSVGLPQLGVARE